MQHEAKSHGQETVRLRGMFQCTFKNVLNFLFNSSVVTDSMIANEASVQLEQCSWRVSCRISPAPCGTSGDSFQMVLPSLVKLPKRFAKSMSLEDIIGCPNACNIHMARMHEIL